QAILQEEVAWLPEKLRAPFVLCCLEGKAKAEAARDLGWKEGTVSGRLAEARQRLRRRLARRGVVLSAARPASALGREAGAAVPHALAGATARAALLFVSGAADPAALSPRVTELTKGALQAMLFSRLKPLIAVVVVLALTGTGLLAYQSWAARPPQPRADAPPPGPRQEPGPGPDLQPLADLHGDPLPARAVVRLGTTRFRHGAGVAALAYSPDGKRLATADWNNLLVRLWDAATGRELRQM